MHVDGSMSNVTIADAIERIGLLKDRDLSIVIVCVRAIRDHQFLMLVMNLDSADKVLCIQRELPGSCNSVPHKVGTTEGASL